MAATERDRYMYFQRETVPLVSPFYTMTYTTKILFPVEPPINLRVIKHSKINTFLVYESKFFQFYM